MHKSQLTPSILACSYISSVSAGDIALHLGNDEDAPNLNALISRWKGLGEFDTWWPCTLDVNFWGSGYWKVDQKNWHVFGLHHAMQISLDDFTRLVHAGGLWVTGKGQKWCNLFKSKLDFPRDVQIRPWGKVGNLQLKWVNFYQGVSEFTDPQIQFQSGHKGPSIIDVAHQATMHPYT